MLNVSSVPSTAGITVYDALIAESAKVNRISMTSLRLLVKNAIGAYGPDEGALAARSSAIASAPAADVARVKSAWNRRRGGVTLEALKPTLYAATPGKLCYLCGLHAAGEVDHYLPVSVFPEYGSHPRNLLVACSTCNGAKADKYCDTTGAPLFWHPYLSSLPRDRFIVATVTVDNDMVYIDFDLVKPASLTNPQFDLICRHFDTLDLAMRYEDETLLYLFNQMYALDEYYEDGGKYLVRSQLAAEARRVRQRYGKNYWLSVALTALSRSDEFCDGGFAPLWREVSYSL